MKVKVKITLLVKQPELGFQSTILRKKVLYNVVVTGNVTIHHRNNKPTINPK